MSPAPRRRLAATLLGVLPRRGRSGELSLSQNATALVAGKVATLGLGFVFWIVAARSFDEHDVGLASGAVAAMMLCVQLALVGVGSAVISLLPEHRGDPGRLLWTAFGLAAGGALAGGALFLAIAGAALAELEVVAASAPYAAIFLAACALGALGVVLDQASTALRRGDQMLVRGTLFGVASLAFVAVVGLAGDADGSLAIFSAWLASGLAACALGAVQLRRVLARRGERAEARPGLARRLLAVGLPNHALTLADRAPGLILPIVVTEVLSPTQNAHWYAAWMMAWVAYVVPVQVGMTLFAEAAREPGELRSLLRRSLRTALLLGVPAALAIAALADPALSLLGSSYADGGAGPLRILVVALLPLAVLQAYYAACRARRRLGEAVATAVLAGAASVVAAGLAGAAEGLAAMAVAWVVVQSLAGAFALVRLRGMSAPGARRAAPRAAVAPGLVEEVR